MVFYFFLVLINLFIISSSVLKKFDDITNFCFLSSKLEIKKSSILNLIPFSLKYLHVNNLHVIHFIEQLPFFKYSHFLLSSINFKIDFVYLNE